MGYEAVVGGVEQELWRVVVLVLDQQVHRRSSPLRVHKGRQRVDAHLQGLINFLIFHLLLKFSFEHKPSHKLSDKDENDWLVENS